jgi:hypothetical protein
MPKTSLQTAAISCLVVWAVIWAVFLLIHISTFEIRGVPGIGFIMLGALAIALIAPVVATVLAGLAVFRSPRPPRGLLVLGCAISAVVGQGLLFLLTKLL